MSRPRPGGCADCGGTRTQHAGDERCWCTRCLAVPLARRCEAYVDGHGADAGPLATPDTPASYVGAQHPDTARRMAAETLPRTGTLRRAVYDLVAAAGHRGMSDDDLEVATGRTHQSVSGARNTLARDLLVVDSGARRDNRHGNPAIVWTTPEAAQPVQEAFGA